MFGIGKYVSLLILKGVWNTGALETISGQLCRELPELREYSATSLKKMRFFCDIGTCWILIRPVTTDELSITKSSVTNDKIGKIYIYFPTQKWEKMLLRVSWGVI